MLNKSNKKKFLYDVKLIMRWISIQQSFHISAHCLAIAKRYKSLHNMITKKLIEVLHIMAKAA